MSPSLEDALVSVPPGTVGTRTVTRTFASVVPPSPFAIRWKFVELAGETVCVPFTGTSPMPSIDTLVASFVRQFRTTDWPRSMASGSAVRVAVGAGPVAAGGKALVGTGAVFLWQPARDKTARLSTQAAWLNTRSLGVFTREVRGEFIILPLSRFQQCCRLAVLYGHTLRYVTPNIVAR